MGRNDATFVVTFEMWEVEEHSIVLDKASTGLSILSVLLTLAAASTAVLTVLLTQNVTEVVEMSFH